MKRALVLSGGGARGAFQVGVMKYLSEINWEPDLVCGTSVGAINAAAYGTGMSNDQLTNLWRTYHRKKMYRVTLPIIIRSLRSRKQFFPLSDTRPLKGLLAEHLKIENLRKSTTDILITALNMNTGQIKYFNQHAIKIDHLMAAPKKLSLCCFLRWALLNNNFRAPPCRLRSLFSNIF